MKISNKRNAISPIIATVLIVAATLIAFAAVAGYIFGVLGQGSSVAQVQVTSSALRAADYKAAGTTATFDCKSTSTGSYLILTNSGTAAATVTGVSIQWAGASNAFTVKASPTISPCTVSAAGGTNANMYLFFATTSTLSVDGVTGQSYQGTVTFSNGETATFTGSFQ